MHALGQIAQLLIKTSCFFSINQLPRFLNSRYEPEAVWRQRSNGFCPTVCKSARAVARVHQNGPAHTLATGFPQQ
jgi:hypothetical protein